MAPPNLHKTNLFTEHDNALGAFYIDLCCRSNIIVTGGRGTRRLWDVIVSKHKNILKWQLFTTLWGRGSVTYNIDNVPVYYLGVYYLGK